jgi:rare lipoprotein A
MRRMSVIALWLVSSTCWGGCRPVEHTKSSPPDSPSAAVKPRAAAPSPAGTPVPHREPVLKQAKETQTGLALFLSRRFQGRKSASGEIFDGRDLIAAHPSYPLGTVVRVINLSNGHAVEVRIVDRGPSLKDQKKGAVIDLSHSAADQLDLINNGKARVRLEVLKWGSGHKD